MPGSIAPTCKEHRSGSNSCGWKGSELRKLIVGGWIVFKIGTVLEAFGMNIREAFYLQILFPASSLLIPQFLCFLMRTHLHFRSLCRVFNRSGGLVRLQRSRSEALSMRCALKACSLAICGGTSGCSTSAHEGRRSSKWCCYRRKFGIIL